MGIVAIHHIFAERRKSSERSEANNFKFINCCMVRCEACVCALRMPSLVIISVNSSRNALAMSVLGCVSGLQTKC